jgi:hypothetical protein
MMGQHSPAERSSSDQRRERCEEQAICRSPIIHHVLCSFQCKERKALPQQQDRHSACKQRQNQQQSSSNQLGTFRMETAHHFHSILFVCVRVRERMHDRPPSRCIINHTTPPEPSRGRRKSVRSNELGARSACARSSLQPPAHPSLNSSERRGTAQTHATHATATQSRAERQSAHSGSRKCTR